MSVAIPDPPEAPDPDECCKGGCCPCVFDYHFIALEKWKASVRALGHDPDAVLARRLKSPLPGGERKGPAR